MIPMSPATIYGQRNLCPECGVRPSLTDPNLRNKMHVRDQYKNTKVIIYGQMPTKNRLCYFCNREITRPLDAAVIEKKRRSMVNVY